ncbi:MAG: adenine phosphoribosyltransferase [Acidimicrobiales bacterium]
MAAAGIVQGLIRDIPDFPEPGIVYKDITPLLADPIGFEAAIGAMAEPWSGSAVDVVIGIEARGFLFGATVARQLGLGFVPVRKPGKLPFSTSSVDYGLEYGTDTLEIHTDAIGEGQRALVIDDVLATGGTAAATAELVRRHGGVLVGFGFLIELDFLGGRHRLDGARIERVVSVGGD